MHACVKASVINQQRGVSSFLQSVSLLSYILYQSVHTHMHTHTCFPEKAQWIDNINLSVPLMEHITYLKCSSVIP